MQPTYWKSNSKLLIIAHSMGSTKLLAKIKVQINDKYGSSSLWRSSLSRTLLCRIPFQIKFDSYST